MAIIQMKKVTAYVMKSDTKKVARALQKAGVMEISRADRDGLINEENQFGAAKAEARLQKVSEAVSVIKRYDHTKKSFLMPKPPVTVDELASEGDREKIDAALAEAEAIEEKMGRIRSEFSKTTNKIAQIAPFMGLEARTEDVHDTAHTVAYCGFLPKESDEALTALTAELNGLFAVRRLALDEEFIPCLIAAHRTVAEQARTRLKELAFTDVKLPEKGGTVKEQVAELKRRIDELEQERKDAEEQAAGAAKNLGILLVYEDHLRCEAERARAIDMMGATGKVQVIDGYICHYDADKLEAAVKSAADVYYLDVRDPSEDDDVPTAIVNNKALTPFEAITDMYSTPAYKGIDPVYILAPFYFIFFGSMLSDAAYGILLTIGSILVLKLKKPEGMFRKVVTVLAICGVSTLIWGALFGSWMGFDATELAIATPLWFNPLENPMMMLYVCIALGLVHILVALGMGFYMLVRDGHWKDAIFDKGFWMLILLAIPVMLIPGGGTAAVVMVLVGAAGLLLTQGRHKKGILKKLMGGLGSLYDVTGYLSDILSYCRIFGMSLATGVISMVFKTIAGMLMGNFVGAIFGAAVFIAGNVFNLGINALGSFVHSARLQYIESFNKFFEAGGRAFSPLSYKAKNKRVVNAK